MGENPERCHFPRYPCAGAAEIFQSGKRCGWGKCTDISRVGCYIETQYPLPVGTEAQLHLTFARTLLDIGAKVIWATPQVGMGMCLILVSPEADKKLAQIIEEATATGRSSAVQVQQAERSAPSSAPVQITREAAPGILAKIIKQINEKGILTKQDLIEIVRTTK